MRSCSPGEIEPSSAMWPSTAMVRPWPAIERAARSAAAIEVGLALYASSITRMPAGVSTTSIRPPATSAVRNPSAHSGAVRPRAQPVAAAARAFDTMCAPATERTTRAEPSGVHSSNRARPDAGSSSTPSARTCASDDWPNITTAAGVCWA